MPESGSYSVAYGRDHLPLVLPPEAEPTVIRKATLPKLPDAAGAIHAALASRRAPPLAELARGRRSACILICDITRPVPNQLFLRPMIEILTAAGIPLARISIVVATGLHRPERGRGTGRTGRRSLGDGERLASPTTSPTHDADHVDLGVTATRGTPVNDRPALAVRPI